MFDNKIFKQLNRRMHSKWGAFIYNFCWSDYVSYIDGWIPRLSLSVPVIGYLILFNDSVSEILVFTHLASENTDSFGLDGQSRLKFIYFGLILLGVSNFIYRIKKPYLFRFGNNQIDYTRTALEIFTFRDYLSMHNTIRTNTHLTPDGNYYDSEWSGFEQIASNHGEGTEHVSQTANWDEARKKYGGLLRRLLSETFFRYDIERRFSLSMCLLFSTIGYLLLLTPSIDLFIKVLISLF